MKYFKLFGIGFFISLIGSIPVGTLNVSVVGLVLNHQFFSAVQFGFGAILIEVVLVWLAITLVEKLRRIQKMFALLNVAMCAVLFVLAILSFMAAYKMEDLKVVIPFSNHYPFLAGMLLSLLNPLHLPFWMGWTAVLRSKNLLVENNFGHGIYAFSTGVGTAISFLIYGLSGNFFIDYLKANHNILNWIIGGTLLLTAIIQSYKMIKHHYNLRKHIHLT